MKNLFLTFFLFIPQMASAVTSETWPAEQYSLPHFSIQVEIHKCKQAKSGFCAKNIKDTGSPLPFVTNHPENVYQVELSPEMAKKVRQRMKETSSKSISAKIEGTPLSDESSKNTNTLVVSEVYSLAN
jgi:hypothetical protein